MALFEKFTDTVFYKESNELENKIKVLTKLQKKYPNNEQLKKELIIAKAGLKGEEQIKFELKNANIGMYVLHDITFKNGDSTAQVDFIVITSYKNYFIECKNLIGDISVNNSGQFVRKYKFNNMIIEKAINSPITQAERHIDIYLKIWKNRHNWFDNTFLSKYAERYNVPLVVVANPNSILDVKYATKEIKKKVIRADQLVNYLKEDLKKASKIDLSNRKEMEEIAKNFESINQPIKRDYEKLFIKNDEKIDSIRDELIKYRSDKAKKRNIPKDYIFTDDELNKIIDIMPEEVDDLKDILSDIKIKYHGKEIVDIINKV